MKKGLLTMAGMLLTVSLVSAGTTVPVLADEETTLVYGSGDYTLSLIHISVAIISQDQVMILNDWNAVSGWCKRNGRQRFTLNPEKRGR